MIVEISVKILPILVTFSYLPVWQAILISLAFILFRRYAVAWWYGLLVMEGMDSATFQTNKESPCNVVCVSYLTTRPEDLKDWLNLTKIQWRPLLKQHVKMRSSIVKVLGEMYYKPMDHMSIDEIIEDRMIMLPRDQITTRAQLEQFVSKQISEPMPEDKPQWQVWLVPNWESDEGQGLWIWKNHHSLCDGISCLAFTLSLDNTYDTTKIIKFPIVTIWTRLFLILMLPIAAIQVAFKSLVLKPDQNLLHDGKRDNLTGQKLVSFGNGQKFSAIKECSRKFECTINDLITSALSIALARYFREHNDLTEHVNLVIPANIRWQMYPTLESVKMENKFAPAQMRIPILEDPLQCLKQIKKRTADLKRSFSLIYFMYIFGIATSLFVSDFVRRKIGNHMTKPYTLAFSNTPGVLKHIKGRSTEVVGMASTVIPFGRVGMCITALSYGDNYRVTGLADTSIISREGLRQIVNYIEQAIQQFIEMGHQIQQEEKKKVK